MISFKSEIIRVLENHEKDKNISAGVLADFIEKSLRNLDKVYEDCIAKVKIGKTTILHGVKSVVPKNATKDNIYDDKVLDVIVNEVMDEENKPEAEDRPEERILMAGQSGELISEKKDLPVVEIKAGEKLPEGDVISNEFTVDVEKAIKRW